MAGISRAQMVPPAACPLLLIGFSLGSVSFCVFFFFLEVQRKGKWLRPLLMPDSSPVVLGRLTTMGDLAGKMPPTGEGASTSAPRAMPSRASVSKIQACFWPNDFCFPV